MYVRFHLVNPLWTIAFLIYWREKKAIMKNCAANILTLWYRNSQNIWLCCEFKWNILWLWNLSYGITWIKPRVNKFNFYYSQNEIRVVGHFAKSFNFSIIPFNHLFLIQTSHTFKTKLVLHFLLKMFAT